MLKVFKWSLIVVCIFLFSCLKDEDKKPSTDEDTSSKPSAEIVRDDTKSNERDDDDRGEGARQERDRLKQDIVLRTNVGDRYSSGGSRSFSNGRECEDYPECKDICNRIMNRSERRCYSYSFNVVEDMKEALFTIRNIDDADRVAIDPYIFEAILTADRSLIADLVEDEMGEGDLKSFLAWVALNDDIAKVLEDEDRSGKILEEAFKRLGRFQEGVTGDYEHMGLNVGLITEDDTFFYLAADEENEAAFTMAYDILNSSPCKEDACQKKVLCARELRTRSVSSRRIFGNTRGVSICRTSYNKHYRASSRSDTCYVHGSTVWSYLYELIDDGDLRGTPAFLKSRPLGIDICNSTCGRVSSRTQVCSTQRADLKSAGSNR